MTPPKNVLVAYDGSAPSRRALEHAADLVGRSGTVTVVNVVSVQSVGARLQSVSDGQRAHQERLLEEASQVLRRRAVAANLVRAAGDPSVEILAAADSMKADVLVVGEHTHRAPHLPGRSVISTLVKRGTFDVLVVH